jgi:hypothetical protein
MTSTLVVVFMAFIAFIAFIAFDGGRASPGAGKRAPADFDCPASWRQVQWMKARNSFPGKRKDSRFALLAP